MFCTHTDERVHHTRWNESMRRPLAFHGSTFMDWWVTRRMLPYYCESMRWLVGLSRNNTVSPSSLPSSSLSSLICESTRLLQMTVFEYWEQRNTHIVDSSLMKSVVDTTRVRRTLICWCWKSIALNVHCAFIASWSWFAATLSQVLIIEHYRARI